MFSFRLLGSSAAADAIRLASDYLCAVVCGHHVQGREFSYVSATPWNRMTFLWTTRLLLEPVARYLQYAAASEIYSACSITHFIGVFLHIQKVFTSPGVDSYANTFETACNPFRLYMTPCPLMSASFPLSLC